MFGGFYSGRRVLVTGHTGFKGGWLSLWLKSLGAAVHGLGLAAPTQPNLHEVIRGLAFDSECECDIRDLDNLQSALGRIQPQVVFHLAAQALVRESYREPLATWQVNTLGVANLLEATRRLEGSWTILVVTTDKCYEPRGWPYGYREIDPLGGHDPYSTSKAAAELVVAGWRQSFFQSHPGLGRVATARAGNVIGGGDYARDRLIPDCVRARLEQRPVQVRNPGAVRPWQHVLDCLSGYLCLAARLADAPADSPLAGSFNFGPASDAEWPVAEVVREWARLWPGPWELAQEVNALPEAARLSLAVDKAASLLGWRGVWDVGEALQSTVAWYQARHRVVPAEMARFTQEQIGQYTEAARKRRAVWTQVGPEL
jgi:CDP-glucose 4,6-dehydratase